MALTRAVLPFDFLGVPGSSAANAMVLVFAGKRLVIGNALRCADFVDAQISSLPHSVARTYSMIRLRITS